MTITEQEIKENYEEFYGDWTTQIEKNWNDLKILPVFLESYRRICALNAIKKTLVIPYSKKDSADFFLEAHNDAIVSHVSASFGSWRSSLQSLRSIIENSLCSIYYNDHPIELQLWLKGEYRIGFTELHKYMCKHPMISDVGNDIAGLDIIKDEYATLSQAVHASAQNFRMTKSSSAILLWNTDKSQAGMWSSRERKVIEGISLLFVCLHRDSLIGSKNSNLREILKYSITDPKKSALKNKLNITI
jgi:hypothetical protein